MAEVHIVDIDGEQWNIKDLPLTERVAVLEELSSTKDLNDVKFNIAPGYTTSISSLSSHYSFGKIHFVNVRFDNLSGNNIGTTATAFIGTINLRPKKDTTFILYDYVNNAILRCYLTQNGELYVGESNGVVPGNNVIMGELIFAES